VVEEPRGTDEDAHHENRTNLVEYLVHNVVYGIGYRGFSTTPVANWCVQTDSFESSAH
jgi:hypothetical protein